MPRPYNADTTDMRVLASTLAALALSPPFAVWDLQGDLAKVSHNGYGDVAVKPLSAVTGHGSLVRCGAWCRFGDGWLAFTARPALRPADVSRARIHFDKKNGWTVELRLTHRAWSRWQTFASRLAASGKRRGVPDVLVVTAAGEVAASPIASQVYASKGSVTVTGFTRASAAAVAKTLR
jgi:hypothetical protein